MVPDNKAAVGTRGQVVGQPGARLAGLSSMATRAVLADLAQEYQRALGGLVAFLSVGGVDAAQRVRNVDGIEVVGGLPPALDIVTTFSGAVGARSRWPEQAAALLRFLAAPAADEAKRRRGMEPARSRQGAAERPA